MNSKFYKYCVVPSCVSSTIKTPKKLFIHVPRNEKRRKMWLRLARKDMPDMSIQSKMFFCEDHFDLPNDMENYMEYHIMGFVSKIRMKRGCIPSKFKCQPDRRKLSSNRTVSAYVMKKRRKELIEEYENDLEKAATIATKQFKFEGAVSGNSESTVRTIGICREQEVLDQTSSDWCIPKKSSIMSDHSESSDIIVDQAAVKENQNEESISCTRCEEVFYNFKNFIEHFKSLHMNNTVTESAMLVAEETFVNLYDFDSNGLGMDEINVKVEREENDSFELANAISSSPGVDPTQTKTENDVLINEDVPVLNNVKEEKDIEGLT